MHTYRLHVDRIIPHSREGRTKNHDTWWNTELNQHHIARRVNFCCLILTAIGSVGDHVVLDQALLATQADPVRPLRRKPVSVADPYE